MGVFFSLTATSQRVQSEQLGRHRCLQLPSSGRNHAEIYKKTPTADIHNRFSQAPGIQNFRLSPIYSGTTSFNTLSKLQLSSRRLLRNFHHHHWWGSWCKMFLFDFPHLFCLSYFLFAMIQGCFISPNLTTAAGCWISELHEL